MRHGITSCCAVSCSGRAHGAGGLQLREQRQPGKERVGRQHGGVGKAAGFNGASFLNYGHDFSSFLMALGFVLALCAYAIGLYVIR